MLVVNVNPFIDVAVAAPIVGVTKVGEVSITKVEPVPVCEPTDVALPTLVITPVKLALVLAVIPDKDEPSPTNFVALNTPVLGTKDKLVDDTFCGKLPVFAVTKVG